MDIARAGGPLLVVVCGLLAGCPQEDAAKSADASSSSRPASTSTSASSAKPYLGMMSIGGTIGVTLDAPDPGRITLAFQDSPFGLHGSLVGNYVPDEDRYVVTSLAANAADPPPAHLLSRLGELQMSFYLEDERLDGDIAHLPSSPLPGAPPLAGLIHATSRRTLPALASIAGEYAFMVTGALHVEGSPFPVHGSNSATAGYARITPDGTLHVCLNQDGEAGCTGAASDASAPVARLEVADQTRYPGVFEVRAEGELAGRMFASHAGDAWTLAIDQQQSLGDKLELAAWVLHSKTPLKEDVLSGNWSCRQPAVNFPLLTTTALAGGMDSHTLWIDGDTIAGGRVPGAGSNLSLNAAFGVFSETRPASVNGLAHVQWFDPPMRADGERIREQVLMPISGRHMVYLSEMRKDLDSVVWGACLRV
ncbi:hypothetical protein [Cupriavidus plantarum]|uniref:hypothetical protein n=2 Tax=Cupriavidus plantarum TaxID=942865 RepID=UPI00339D5704